MPIDSEMGQAGTQALVERFWSYTAEAFGKWRLARFEREAKLLASLNHPNIATIHGLEECEGQQFLVMERH